jgi:ABC-2 type transport system permease protein
MKSITQVLSFIAKEIQEILRQPRLVLSLILGPFLILLLFGLSYSGDLPKFNVVVVVPPNTLSQEESARLRESVSGNLTLIAIDSDEDTALARLRQGEANLVEVLPAGLQQNLLAGKQSTVKFIYSVTNPFDDRWIEYLCTSQVNRMNRDLLASTIGQVQSQTGVGPDIPPETLVSPLEPEFTNLRGEPLSYVDYYAPSVLALIIQHIAVTLGALSLVREKGRGMLEMFRVAPISGWNVIIGKYFGYSVFVMLLAVLLAALLVVLGTPFLGSYYSYIAFMLIYVLASLGIGFLISCLSNSDTTAVQLSMLVLLISVFFSGFFLPLENFALWVKPIVALLPLTHGIQGLQDTMLKGIPPDQYSWIALFFISVVTFGLVQLMFRRQLRRIYV